MLHCLWISDNHGIVIFQPESRADFDNTFNKADMARHSHQLVSIYNMILWHYWHSTRFLWSICHRCTSKVGSWFNVQMPLGVQLGRKWYTRPSFNRHSTIMYDLLLGSDLILNDFKFQQSVKYTFLWQSGVYIWTDHIAVWDSMLKMRLFLEFFPVTQMSVITYQSSVTWKLSWMIAMLMRLYRRTNYFYDSLLRPGQPRY